MHFALHVLLLNWLRPRFRLHRFCGGWHLKREVCPTAVISNKVHATTYMTSSIDFICQNGSSIYVSIWYRVSWIANSMHQQVINFWITVVLLKAWLPNFSQRLMSGTQEKWRVTFLAVTLRRKISILLRVLQNKVRSRCIKVSKFADIWKISTNITDLLRHEHRKYSYIKTICQVVY